jgi:gluconokinase
MTMASVVVMGVAGCGKSSVGRAIAETEGLPLIEGDDHHSDHNKARMAAGTPLTDADRDGWLATLGAQLQAHPGGAVLSCSALKRAYRERLRAASPGLRFVFLEITPDEAQARVSARAATHFFSTRLVASQFETLEPPNGEAGVLVVDARLPIAALAAKAHGWLREMA